MANYKAVASGNRSSLSTRQDDSGGSFSASTVLPWVNDDVYSNTFTVEIDQDIEVNLLRNTARTEVTLWWVFEITSNNDINIIATTEIYAQQNLKLLDITSASTTNEITISAGRINWWYQSYPITYDWSWTLNVYGTLSCITYSTYGLNITRGGSTVNFFWTINRVADNRSYWIYCYPTNEPENKNTINIVWYITDWAASWLYLRKTNTSNEFEFTFEGIIDTTTWNWWLEIVQWYITWYINNSVFEWTWAAIKLYNSAAYFNPNSKITLDNVSVVQTGNISPLIYSPASPGWLHLHFIDCDINQIWTPAFPIWSSYATFEYTQAKSWNLINYDNTSTYMYSSYVWNPMESNVRDWIVYWWNSELEWTLIVPSPSNVASGVPTDDTVWTADFKLTWVMTALWVVNEWVQKASKFIPHTTNL